MTTFVLIPGAWHGAWCWERVIPLLAAAGHRALAPELHGMGADQARAAEATLAGWVEQIGAALQTEPAPVVLVGHSRGGAVISEVAERWPERVAGLVYVAALLLPDGTSVRDTLANAAGAASVDIARHDDGTCTIAAADVGPALYNTTPPDWTARAIDRLGPEPRGVLRSPVRVTAERFGRVPRHYVECRQDRTIPLATQRAMQAAWPCATVATLDCDHSPFYSAPEALAATLLDLAGRPAP
ncbi:alpha/beta fold hydrolase [Novosphingobium piscinae]|uniref:Alpha/beta fold hydrolase n=1 Tax=Novosphingobium piscinae TaxID=1507448 RepID=A0A7X1G165_9SPHN|nr:alpha/beta fold hydrolase [Novosphingobium piscinae]MBC2670733.1 alpha/beta fold hydrolase [Novosphingobium piscinae]